MSQEIDDPDVIAQHDRMLLIQENAQLREVRDHLDSMYRSLLQEKNRIRADLDQVKEVLAWASENVEFMKHFEDEPKRWYAYWGLDRAKAETLYSALHAACKAHKSKGE